MNKVLVRETVTFAQKIHKIVMRNLKPMEEKKWFLGGKEDGNT